MNIAILGGRFDPPHWGHFWVASQVLERGPNINKIWLMPTHIHPWKASVAESQDRLIMAKFLETAQIKASSIEIDKGGTSFTIETIRFLKENYQEHQFFWIVGSDAIADFAKWRHAQKLANLVPFLVFPRSGYPIKLLPFGMKKIDGEEIIQTNLSSTHIRDRLQKGLSIYGLVPSEVEEYIKQKHLYQ